jgi:hypothetical protein
LKIILTYDGFVNGTYDKFKVSKMTYYDKIIIWIMFQICKIRTLIREKYNHYYNNIESKWTPIEPINKNIKVGKMQSFIITRIQLTTTRTIQHSQGLSLNELVFYLTFVFKNGLTYIYIYI